MKKALRIGLWVATAAGVGAALAAAMRPRPIAVELAEVRRGGLRVTVDEDGRTRLQDRYVVSAPLAGKLARIALHPGDRVEAGGVLARIDPVEPPLLDVRSRGELEARLKAGEAARSQAKSAVERARTSYDFARREAERTRGLAATRSVPAQALERAEMEESSRSKELESTVFAGKVAEYELEMARVALRRAAAKGGSLDRVEVTSPIDGLVLRVMQESEGVVGAGAPLLELGDPAALEVVVDVLSSDAVRIPAGAPVTIERWGGTVPLQGHVARVEPAAFTKVSALGIEEQRVNVVVQIDEPHERWLALGDGFRVEARITVEQRTDVLKVPASALFREGDRWMLYVERGGRAERVPVQIGTSSGVETEITGGVEADAKVVVQPGDRIQPGTAIAPRGAG